MAIVYVTGHRNPDTDSIASAIGYAELKGRLDPRNEYVPVRLGDVNAQTRWVLDRARRRGARSSSPHVMLRVRDVMRRELPARRAHASRSARSAAMMAREDLDLVPIVDDDGALAGVMTERALARRYIRESREAVEPATRRRRSSAIVARARGRAGRRRRRPRGRRAASGCMAMDIGSLPSEIGAGDVVVVGNRDDAQRRGDRARRRRCS